LLEVCLNIFASTAVLNPTIEYKQRFTQYNISKTDIYKEASTKTVSSIQCISSVSWKRIGQKMVRLLRTNISETFYTTKTIFEQKLFYAILPEFEW
jgi:hypothetical protein